MTLQPQPEYFRQLLNELAKQTDQPAKYAPNVYDLTAKVSLKNAVRNNVKLETRGLVKKA